MIIAVDSTALVLIVNPDARPPIDPSTGSAVDHMPERMAKFIADADAKKHVLLVPTPVLAEVLVKVGESGPELVRRLRRLARFRLVSFDERAAFELAAMTTEAIANGDKRGGHDQPWQKVKLDRQIIAIARVHGAERIFSDDEKLVAFARRLGLIAESSWDLSVPESETDLFAAAGLTTGPNVQPPEQDETLPPNSAFVPDFSKPRRLIQLDPDSPQVAVVGESSPAASSGEGPEN